MWAAIDDDVHSDVRKTIDASRRQRYIIQENSVPFMKIGMLIVSAIAIVMLKMMIFQLLLYVTCIINMAQYMRINSHCFSKLILMAITCVLYKTSILFLFMLTYSYLELFFV